MAASDLRAEKYANNKVLNYFIKHLERILALTETPCEHCIKQVWIQSFSVLCFPALEWK